ncbi:MAG TPA: YIP1 family protein [Thermoanaerobaculia bacterium]|nr:YIP1 family protein [Thermoanaerobaculia bacterium]
MMTSDAPAPEGPRPFLQTFGSILLFPRRTMRRILSDPRKTPVVWLVVAACYSSMLPDLDFEAASEISGGLGPGLYAALIAFIGIVLPLLAVCLFYALSWIAFMAGRQLEGSGTLTEVRAAMAWGLAPVIAALVYRIPVVLMRAAGMGGEWRSRSILRAGDESLIVAGSTPAGVPGLIFVLLEGVLLLAWIWVTSRCLAEAHQFSSTRGLGTLILTFVLPAVAVFILVSAAILSRYTS